MKMLLTLCAVLCALACWSQAAEMTYPEAISGKPFPLTVKLKEMDQQWSRFTRGDPAQGTLTMAFFGIFEKMGMGGSTYYSQGQTVTIGGETYLIAYARPRKTLDLRQLGEPGMANIEPITGETTLTLSLLNMRAAGSLLDIRAFDLAQELSAAQAAEKFLAAEQMKARQNTNISNLRQVATSIMMWVQDHDEQLPAVETWAEDMVNDVNVDKHVLTSPWSNEPYIMNAFLSKQALGDIAANLGEMVLLYETTPWPDGRRGVAFLDGHVEMVTAERWEQAKRVSHIP